MTLKQPQCGEMKNAVSAFNSFLKDICLQDVASNIVYRNPAVLKGFCQVFFLSAGKIVVDNDFAYISKNKLIN